MSDSLLPKPIVTLAVLQATTDRGEDYIDAFVPFVKETVFRAAAGLREADLGNAIEEQFGIRIPQGALATVLRRAKQQRLVSETGGVLKAHQKSEALTQAANLIAEFETLATALAQYSKDAALVPLDASSASQGLLDFVIDYAGSILKAFINGGHLDLPSARLAGLDYVVGRFIVDAFEGEQGRSLACIEALAKGAMLAGSLLFPDISAVKKRFRTTQVFLDTKFVLQLLGLEGPAEQTFRQETVAIARDRGATIHVFPHTVDEILGILSSASYAVNDSRAARRSYGPTVRYMMDAKWRKSEIELAMVGLPRDLQKLSITVTDIPSYDEPRYVIDEGMLTSDLQQRIQYRRNDALANDVSSLSAIMRLRRGRWTEHIEDSAAIFVTTNKPLVSASRAFTTRRQGREPVPPAMVADDFTTICWLKDPAKFPDLPRERVLADALSVLNPDDSLWDEWAEQVERLEAKGGVDGQMADLLRYSVAARSTLMDATLGDKKVLEQRPETVDIIVARVTAALTDDIRQEALIDIEARDARAEALSANLVAQTARADRAERESTVQREALGKLVANVLSWAIVGIPSVSFAAYAAFAGIWGQGAGERFVPAGISVGLVLGVVLANLVLGWNARTPVKWLSVRLLGVGLRISSLILRSGTNQR